MSGTYNLHLDKNPNTYCRASLRSCRLTKQSGTCNVPRQILKQIPSGYAKYSFIEPLGTRAEHTKYPYLQVSCTMHFDEIYKIKLQIHVLEILMLRPLL